MAVVAMFAGWVVARFPEVVELTQRSWRRMYESPLFFLSFRARECGGFGGVGDGGGDGGGEEFGGGGVCEAAGDGGGDVSKRSYARLAYLA